MPSDVTKTTDIDPDGAPATVSGILRAHLIHDKSSRRLWLVKAERTRRGTVNQAAVAQVLAEWLWDNGEASEEDVQLPRRLKDKVSRALTDNRLTPQTLRTFIAAFNIPGPVADTLWDAQL